MSEVNGDEINEVNEVDEVDESENIDDDLSEELDDKYDEQLNNPTKYEHKETTEKKELDKESDSKYNNKERENNESNIDNAETQPEKIKCRNESLEGNEHPETGVPFEKKQVDVDGKQYEVVVPEFDSAYDAQLPESMLKSSDAEQFKECNNQLKEAVANDPELREKFDEEQLDQIENGETPDGYTWHHDAEVGKMQLVDSETHQKTGHTGGRAIWGGGTDCR